MPSGRPPAALKAPAKDCSASARIDAGVGLECVIIDTDQRARRVVHVAHRDGLCAMRADVLEHRGVDGCLRESDSHVHRGELGGAEVAGGATRGRGGRSHFPGRQRGRGVLRG
eukprot:scaffold218495_cov31-Tisochrysis_lutea.AAC.3